jgi:hypothetical protein
MRLVSVYPEGLALFPPFREGPSHGVFLCEVPLRAPGRVTSESTCPPKAGGILPLADAARPHGIKRGGVGQWAPVCAAPVDLQGRLGCGRGI